jgi:hypothetical protein
MPTAIMAVCVETFTQISRRLSNSEILQRNGKYGRVFNDSVVRILHSPNDDEGTAFRTHL